ncbi:hypothetical protein AK812_SmicGene15198 [Symbiodinium microadriaticum]|uniref:Uncharacterized protein n=1 Tax=Symbiodinium microadriaticum TaxID=2951 RepID=A0A1Q9E3G0_SYMMI|nr:hypothetical protein AK812_SmicGene15198 [Symbiodinium microadriaticum]
MLKIRPRVGWSASLPASSLLVVDDCVGGLRFTSGGALPTTSRRPLDGVVCRVGKCKLGVSTPWRTGERDAALRDVRLVRRTSAASRLRHPSDTCPMRLRRTSAALWRGRPLQNGSSVRLMLFVRWPVLWLTPDVAHLGSEDLGIPLKTYTDFILNMKPFRLNDEGLNLSDAW